MEDYSDFGRPPEVFDGADLGEDREVSAVSVSMLEPIGFQSLYSAPWLPQ